MQKRYRENNYTMVIMATDKETDTSMATEKIMRKIIMGKDRS
ncbi:hypothetical protein J45TS6_47200 [Paenibacillus sp. J45TS6]|nr:hypothetical protein [Paenibacillus sp. J45TS6]GIP46261.1 hypothetical protein J45TS6_47200 [Paenibacillus sp. J45TS6]